MNNVERINLTFGDLTAIAREHRIYGGSTFALYPTLLNMRGTPGYAVAIATAHEHVVEGRQLQVLGVRSIASFMSENADLLTSPGHCLGTWFNPADGRTYLEVSIVVPTLDAALTIARNNSQLAVYDLAAGACIDVPALAESEV